MKEKYVIGFLVESYTREQVRDATGILERIIKDRTDLKIIDLGYVVQDNLEQLTKYMKQKGGDDGIQ